jgi:hypothetical protein
LAILIGAALAFGFVGYAGAAEVQRDKAPVVKAQKMSDSEMDKVTAGTVGDPLNVPAAGIPTSLLDQAAKVIIVIPATDTSTAGTAAYGG